MLANSYVGTQPSHWAQPLVNSSTHTHVQVPIRSNTFVSKLFAAH